MKYNKNGLILQKYLLSFLMILEITILWIVSTIVSKGLDTFSLNMSANTAYIYKKQ
jgi:hypothetical protein